MTTSKLKAFTSAVNVVLVALTLMLCIVACGNSGGKKTAIDSSDNTETAKEEKSNGVFEIIGFSKDSIQFKTEAETKFYAIALVANDEVYEGKSFSNLVDTVYWANGAQFWPGSSMNMPAVFGVGAMTLPKGAVLKITGFGTPEGFEPSKIKFVTDGETEMYYNISQSSWEK
ncbi:MAG: hypothetical protein LBG19_05360 [Prevotellaceae bacterium]|jgi:hypothetical protein|nr:hypothetical protein [Prevotellaceae bacterium]